MGMTVFIVLGMMTLAIRTCWDLRERIWFWAVIVLMLALHVTLFFVVRWPPGLVHGIMLLPIGVADYLIFLGAVHLVEKFIVKPPPGEDGPPAPFVQIKWRR